MRGNGYEVSLWGGEGNENVLKLDSIMPTLVTILKTAGMYVLNK